MDPITAFLAVAIALLDNFGKIAPILDRMKAEGRTSFTPEEWTVVNTALDSAKARAEAAVAGLA